ncbi:MAG: cytochrome C [Woeseiaceae bacterium]|nr:cytochrome C [Woeseiaceae bacterium]
MKRSLLLCLVLTLAAGCDRDMMSERGFALPEGDATAGEDAFLYMQCNQCHSIAGVELPTVPGYDPYVELGGKVTRVKTYGQLVTAIINPSHKLAAGYAEEQVSEEGGESRMYNYNRYMTVQELTDLVMFLQPHYDVVVPTFKYPIYP